MDAQKGKTKTHGVKLKKNLFNNEYPEKSATVETY